MGLKLEHLERCFTRAKEEGIKYVGVRISMPNFEKFEVIINPIENFEKKLEYYQNAYTDDLKLKAFNEIKIIGFTFGNSYADIERDLVG